MVRILPVLLVLTSSLPCLAQTAKYPLQRGDKGLVSEVSWSPKNNLILTSSFDENSLRLWDVATGRLLWKSEIGFLQDNLELYAIRQTAWTSDQRFIVTGNDNGKLQLWEAATGKLVWNIKAHGDSVTSIAVSPDDKFIVSSSEAPELTGELKIWSFTDGQLVRDISANQMAIDRISFIDTSRFRVGDSRCRITTWSVSETRPLSVKQITNCKILRQQYVPFVYSPHFRFLAAQTNKTLFVIETNTGKVRKRIARANNSGRVCFTENENMLILPDLGDSDILDLKSNSTTRKEFDGIPNIDGSLIAAEPSYRNDGIQIFDSKTNKLKSWLVGHPGIIKALAFSSDGKRFVSGSNDKIVRIWDTETKQLLSSLSGHSGNVETVTFSKDGKTLKSQSEEETIIWDADKGKKITQTNNKTHFESNRNGAISPSGRLALIEEYDKPFRLVNASDGTTVKEFAYIDQLDTLEFLPDEQHFLAKPWWNGWQLWSVEGSKPIREFDLGYSYYNRVAFHPDGKLFITGGEGQNIFMFELDTGRMVWSLFPIDEEEFKWKKASEDRRIGFLNRKKESARLADIENKTYEHKVFITFDHYGDMVPIGLQRIAESDEPVKSKKSKSASDSNAVWLRLHNDSPLPISVPTQSMYFTGRKCFFEFPDHQKMFGLCDEREISVWLGLEDRNGKQLPYGFDFGSSIVLLPGTSVLFAVDRALLTNGQAITFEITFQKPKANEENDDYGNPKKMKFSEADFPR